MTKRAVADLALFGGPPSFSRRRFLGQLDTPDPDEFIAELRGIHGRRRLSNDGPCVHVLEQELAAFHGVAHCVAVANAGVGLTMLLQCLGRAGTSEVIMPAFTYPGLPHFAGWAGKVPRYCDLDESNHALDPDCVEAALSSATACILSVSNFNFPGYLRELERLSDAFQVPLILDSVDGIGSSYGGVRMGGFGDAEVFSTHATKVLSGFEGGYITTNDGVLAEQLRSQRNFALPPFTPHQRRNLQAPLGINGKLNEIHAAAALLALRKLDQTIERNRKRYQAYEKHIGTLEGVAMLPVCDASTEQRAYQFAIIELAESWPLKREVTMAILKAEGADCGPYYSPTLLEAYPQLTLKDQCELPVTKRLSGKFLRLPVGRFTSPQDAQQVAELLGFMSSNAEEILVEQGRRGLRVP